MKLRCCIGLHKWDFTIQHDRILRMCRKCGSMYCWKGSVAGESYPLSDKPDRWVLLFKDASQYFAGKGEANLRFMAIKPIKPFNYYDEEELGLHDIRN